MLPHTISRTSPERLGCIEGCLNSWRCQYPKWGDLEQQNNPCTIFSIAVMHLGVHMVFKRSVLQLVTTQPFLIALGEKISYWADYLASRQGEGQCSCACLSTKGFQTGASALHCRQGEHVEIQSNLGPFDIALTFSRFWCICLICYWEIFWKWRFFSVFESPTKHNETKKWFSCPGTL